MLRSLKSLSTGVANEAIALAPCLCGLARLQAVAIIYSSGHCKNRVGFFLVGMPAGCGFIYASYCNAEYFRL